MNSYDITKKNLHEKPYNYSYSKFEGKKFLKSYFQNRERALNALSKKNLRILSLADEKNCKTLRELNKILKLKKKLNKFDILLKRFEVSKKIYDEYSYLFVKKNKNFSRVENYLKFGLILCKYYSLTKKKNYLNALLKLNDLLISPCFFSKSSKYEDFQNLINNEISFIKKLYEKI
jgi:hypothetical protein